jgi:hypothetical protein
MLFGLHIRRRASNYSFLLWPLLVLHRRIPSMTRSLSHRYSCVAERATAPSPSLLAWLECRRWIQSTEAHPSIYIVLKSRCSLTVRYGHSEPADCEAGSNRRPDSERADHVKTLPFRNLNVDFKRLVFLASQHLVFASGSLKQTASRRSDRTGRGPSLIDEVVYRLFLESQASRARFAYGCPSPLLSYTSPSHSSRSVPSHLVTYLLNKHGR